MKRSHARTPTPSGKPGSNATLEAERDEVLATQPGDMYRRPRDKAPTSDPAKQFEKRGG